MKEENKDKVKNPMSIKGIAEHLKVSAEVAIKDYSDGEQVTRKSAQKTASISSILKNWIQSAAAVFKLDVQGVVENKTAVIVYTGEERIVKIAMLEEKLVSDWIMEMVKKNSDGTRANSVALKRQYFEDLKTEILSFDMFEGAEKLDAELKEQKAERKEQAKSKIQKQKKTEEAVSEFEENAEEFSEQVAEEFEENLTGEDFEETPSVEGEFEDEFGDDTFD